MPVSIRWSTIDKPTLGVRTYPYKRLEAPKKGVHGALISMISARGFDGQSQRVSVGATSSGGAACWENTAGQDQRRELVPFLTTVKETNMSTSE